ncbi:MAG: nucleotidyl transferase AbiEii/AbiGii toxin family protein [Treponema sp.]|jgi:hypothetical protein|nr:nucleotidyl transferase AbiEii/AbiGii toxin family protein [Treponema sp.]
MLNSHYRDILLRLPEKEAKFLLVGAYALAVHGFPRSTVDIDLLVMPDSENAQTKAFLDWIMSAEGQSIVLFLRQARLAIL